MHPREEEYPVQQDSQESENHNGLKALAAVGVLFLMGLIILKGPASIKPW
jgi:hypothetical protein